MTLQQVYHVANGVQYGFTTNMPEAEAKRVLEAILAGEGKFGKVSSFCESTGVLFTLDSKQYEWSEFQEHLTAIYERENK